MSHPSLDPLRRPRVGAPAAGAVWTDSGRLDEGWRPPRRLGSLPRWVLVGVPLVVIAALVATVAVLGGFGARTDRLVRLPTDAVVTSGPYQMTFGVGVASPAKDNDDQLIWTVSIVGTIQTTDPTGDRPGTAGDGFVAVNVPTNADLAYVDSVRVGDRIGQDFTSGQVTPGLAPVPIRWTFQLPRTSPPTALIRLVVWQQEFSDDTITQTGEEDWHTTRDGFELLVPITVVTPAS